MNCLMKIALMMLRQYLNLNSYYIIVIWYHGVRWSWSGVQKIFVQIAKNICPNCEPHLTEPALPAGQGWLVRKFYQQKGAVARARLTLHQINIHPMQI